MAAGEPAIDANLILDRASLGLAVIDLDLRLCWRNATFDELAPATPAGNGLVDRFMSAENKRAIENSIQLCLTGTDVARCVLPLAGHRFLACQIRLLSPPAPDTQILCSIRDITSEVLEREKLQAIHRAGVELRHLTPEELEEMTENERVDLLKANIMQYSQQILSFKNFEVRLLDPKSGELTVLLSEGMTAAANQRVLHAEAEGQGVTGYVAATGKSYLCMDVSKDALYIPGAPDAKSSLTVPIAYQGQVIGTFNVESPLPRRFGESDRIFLEIFAKEIAVALKNLELLEAEKQLTGRQSMDAIVRQVSLPIDAIMGDAIKLSEEMPDNPGLREAVQRIFENGRRLRKVIQSMAQAYGPPTPKIPNVSLYSNKRILFVDSEESTRLAAITMLRQVNCAVETATTGYQASLLARTIEYDLAIGDIRLPDMHGYDFFKRMKTARPAMPVVLMTGFGYDPTHSIVLARQEGLKSVLYKPFRLDRLCESMRDALAGGPAAPK